MQKQVVAGKMLGGPGWSCGVVGQFFGGRCFYGIPCGATEKDGDPCGRIIHDYGFYKQGGYSVNSTHSSTRVKYNTVKQKMEILEKVL